MVFECNVHNFQLSDGAQLSLAWRPWRCGALPSRLTQIKPPTEASPKTKILGQTKRPQLCPNILFSKKKIKILPEIEERTKMQILLLLAGLTGIATGQTQKVTDDGVLAPKYFNLAKGSRIHASATCGEEHPEGI